MSRSEYVQALEAVAEAARDHYRETPLCDPVLGKALARLAAAKPAEECGTCHDDGLVCCDCGAPPRGDDWTYCPAHDYGDPGYPSSECAACKLLNKPAEDDQPKAGRTPRKASPSVEDAPRRCRSCYSTVRSFRWYSTMRETHAPSPTPTECNRCDDSFHDAPEEPESNSKRAKKLCKEIMHHAPIAWVRLAKRAVDEEQEPDAVCLDDAAIGRARQAFRERGWMFSTPPVSVIRAAFEAAMGGPDAD